MDSSSEQLNTYLILSNGPIDPALLGLKGSSVVFESKPPPTPLTGCVSSTPTSSPPLQPIPRHRVATWTFSPDSGYSDHVASPGPPESPNHTFGGTLKRRANTTEDLIESGVCTTKVLRQFEEAGKNKTGSGKNSGGEQPSRKDLKTATTVYSREWPQFPISIGTTELCVVRQPETQHRPRYETEGSRGRIKDRSGGASPIVQLKGFRGHSALLHVFIGEEKDPIVPHPLYKVCKVNNKHTSPAIIRTLEDKTTVLEMAFTAKENWTLSVDCVSIMKLRNVDFEESTANPDDLKKTKRKPGSPKVRLIFRAFLTAKNGKTEVMQIASSPISCCATPGIPEVSFVSHKSAPVCGGTDVVVIGRNFIKNDTKLLVVEKGDNDEDTVWQAEATMRNDKFNQVHLVAAVPAYRSLVTTTPVDVFLVVKNSDGKQSDPLKFQYTPNPRFVESVPLSPLPPPEPTEACTRSATSSPPPASPGAPAASPIFQTSDSSTSANCVHYCLQLPGSQQPLIITIPQQSAPIPQASIAPPRCLSRITEVSPRSDQRNHFVPSGAYASCSDAYGLHTVHAQENSNDMNNGCNQSEYCSPASSDQVDGERQFDGEMYFGKNWLENLKYDIERSAANTPSAPLTPQNSLHESQSAGTPVESDQAVFDELLREIFGPGGEQMVSFGESMEEMMPNVSPGVWPVDDDTDMDTTDYRS